MKNNKIVIVAGILLLVVTFFGILAYGRLMNPDPVYILTAKSDINQGTSLVSLTMSKKDPPTSPTGKLTPPR